MLLCFVIAIYADMRWSDIVHWGQLQTVINRLIPRWTDAERLRSCFNGKLVMVLGDSSATEYVHMMFLLLTGYASGNSESSLKTLVTQLTHQFRAGAQVHVNLQFVNATATFNPNHRRMTIDWTARENMTGVWIDLIFNSYPHTYQVEFFIALLDIRTSTRIVTVLQRLITMSFSRKLRIQ